MLFQRKSIEFDAHYAFQSAWVSHRLLGNRPARHVDISSDLRFVMQLAAFVPVTYLEYRPLHLHLPNLTILNANINQLPFANCSIVSLSCLHVIEHLGLGRYGDALDPLGYCHGLRELVRVLAAGGRLFLSVPIGCAATHFNAHRIFHPSHLPTIIPELILEEFSVITTDGHYFEYVTPADYASEEYACGLYLLRRA
jgi:hypothetical protein